MVRVVFEGLGTFQEYKGSPEPEFPAFNTSPFLRVYSPSIMTPNLKLPAKKRQAFTDIERKDMCEWVAEQILHSSERPHWKKVQSWFSETHNGKVISQSVISRTLLERSADLVGQPLSAQEGSIKKKRWVEWPELDEALFLWQRKMQARVPVTGDILKEKARGFFAEIYPG